MDPILSLVVELQADHRVDAHHVGQLGDVNGPQAEVNGVHEVQQLADAVHELPVGKGREGNEGSTVGLKHSVRGLRDADGQACP